MWGATVVQQMELQQPLAASRPRHQRGALTSTSPQSIPAPLFNCKMPLTVVATEKTMRWIRAGLGLCHSSPTDWRATRRGLEATSSPRGLDEPPEADPGRGLGRRRHQYSTVESPGRMRITKRPLRPRRRGRVCRPRPSSPVSRR